MEEALQNELESARTEFAGIIAALIEARMEYQTTVRPDAQSVIDATKGFLPKLDEALKSSAAFGLQSAKLAVQIADAIAKVVVSRVRGREVEDLFPRLRGQTPLHALDLRFHGGDHRHVFPVL